MILKNLSTAPRQAVNMTGAEKVQMQLLCGPADGCENFAMRQFIVKPGGCTPRHQHDYEHEVLILEGRGVALGNGKENAIAAGDVLFVPANELHQFRNTGPGSLRFICMVPAFVHKPGGAGAAGGGQPVAVDCGKDAAAK